jgi:hypothetical protein
MYYCSKCKKPVTICPACKQQIKDSRASLLNQITGFFVFVILIFVSLEIKVKEETDLAMKPFRQAEEETRKNKKVKEAGPPKTAKITKSEKKNKKKKTNGSAKKADFRAGAWGMLKSAIIEEENAPELEVRNAPYNIDYLTKIADHQVIAQYMFAQNRLSGGCYILLGNKIENVQTIRDQVKLKVGEPTPSWIKLDFDFYSEYASNSMSSIESSDEFFYDMYISLMSQMGKPTFSALEDLETALGRNEKIKSVLAYNRMINYTWETKRSKVNFYFAGYDNTPYFRIEYLSQKLKDKLK